MKRVVCVSAVEEGCRPGLAAKLTLRLSPRWHFVPPVMVLAAGRGAKADRAISTGQLRGLPRFHLRPINVMVSHGSQRDLVLKGVSRLDAFSGYPVRT